MSIRKIPHRAPSRMRATPGARPGSRSHRYVDAHSWPITAGPVVDESVCPENRRVNVCVRLSTGDVVGESSFSLGDSKRTQWALSHDAFPRSEMKFLAQPFFRSIAQQFATKNLFRLARCGFISLRKGLRRKHIRPGTPGRGGR